MPFALLPGSARWSTPRARLQRLRGNANGDGALDLALGCGTCSSGSSNRVPCNGGHGRFAGATGTAMLSVHREVGAE